MLRIIASGILLLSVGACGKASGPIPQRVSIVQLVGAPSTWDGKLVRAIGFLRLEHEGDALYLHEDDFRHRLSDNAVGVDIPESFPGRAALSMNYVLVEGIFRAADRGDAASFPGTISAVQRAEVWSSPEDPGARFRTNTP